MKKIVCWVVFLYAHTVVAGPSELLQDKLNALRTMSARFSQTVKAHHREVSRSSGEMALARPGRFRWHTKKPMEQVVIADGKRLWVYDVELEQVTVQKQEKSVGGTAGLFLSGYNDRVAHDFDVTVQVSGLRTSFDLSAESSKAPFQRVTLVFEGSALRDMVLHDQLGQVTEIALKDIQTNPKLKASLFQFKPPRGVDVVEQ